MRKTLPDGLNKSVAARGTRGRPGIYWSMLFIGAAAAPAYSQEIAAQSQNRAEPIEEVIVTGTRLSNPNMTSSSPVTVLSEADIAMAGDTATIESTLNKMPQFTPDGASSTTFSSGQEIVSSADLRGLGANRTLVLVNGTRYVPATTNGVVDLNTIPSALVERIDIVTGGASAVYGSDAIAGVVNFILKDDFEGLRLRGGTNITGRGDGLAYEVGLTAGANLNGGRGNVVLDVTYSDREEIIATSRFFATDQLGDSTCVPGSLDSRGAGSASSDVNAVPCYVETGSGTLPAGTINNSITFDPQGNPITPRPPGLYHDFFDDNYIQLPLERWSATTLGRYSVHPAAEVYSRFVYTTSRTARNQSGTSTSVASAGLLDLNLDNPFLTPATRALLEPLDTDFDGITQISLARRFLETGPRTILLRSNAFQVLAGVRGSIFENWRYDAHYQYGQVDRYERFGGDIAQSKLQQSLLAVAGPDGAPVCLNPANGCAPANIFGEGNVSPEAADFLRTVSTRSTESIEHVAGAYVAGTTESFLKLPAGAIGVVVGAEWRKSEATTLPDLTLQTETIAQLRELPTSGDYDVSEVFAELNVPLLYDRPLAQSLTVKTAVRLSDYSLDGVGRVSTWNAGAMYEPIEGLTFRGEFQRAIRAPNVRELFQGRRFSIANADDPCSDRIPAELRTAELEAICLATGVPASEVFGNLQPASNEIASRSGGNPNLEEEASDTFTMGLIYESSLFDGLALTIDYYDIDIENAIAFFGGGPVNTMNLCYFGFRDAASIYCSAIDRNPITGQIASIQGDYANVSKFQTSGVDMQLRHSFPLGFGLMDRASELMVNVRGTHVLDKTTQAEPAADVLECAGLFGSRCGEPTPEWKFSNSLLWSTGPLDLNLTWRYLSGVSWDGQYTFANDFLDRGESFSPSPMLGVEIGAESYFDLSGQWQFEHFDVIVGIDNLFDREPPIVGASKDENSNTWPGTYDPFGRKFFASVVVGL